MPLLVWKKKGDFTVGDVRTANSWSKNPGYVNLLESTWQQFGMRSMRTTVRTMRSDAKPPARCSSKRLPMLLDASRECPWCQWMLTEFDVRPLDGGVVPCQLVIAVGTPVTRCPPHGPGRALISASGSYLG